MKGLLLTFLIFPFCVSAQNSEYLGLTKTSLEKRIFVLQDSLKLVLNKIEADKFNKLNKSSDGNLFIKVNKGGKIRSSPSNPTEAPLFTFLDTASVKTYSYSDGYFKILHNGLVGYINDLYINDKDEAINHYEKIKQLKLKSQARKSESEMIKKYGKSVYEKLKAGYYWIGMTSEMALISRGLPDQVNSTAGNWGISEQWVYKNIYLYFENEKLTSYKNSSN